MQKLQRRGRPNKANSAIIRRESVPGTGDRHGTPVKYRVTVECRATIQEAWAFESNRPLSHDELEDELFAGNMRYIGEEIIGDEEGRRIIRVETQAVSAQS